MFSPIVKLLTYYITVRAFKKFTVRTNYSLSKKRLYRSNLYNRSMSLLFIHFGHLQTETSNLFTYLSSDIPYSSHPQDIHHSCNAYQIHHHASIDILPNDKKNLRHYLMKYWLSPQSAQLCGNIFSEVVSGWHSYTHTSFLHQFNDIIYNIFFALCMQNLIFRYDISV